MVHELDLFTEQIPNQDTLDDNMAHSHMLPHLTLLLSPFKSYCF